jgi:hypothetical protein
MDVDSLMARTLEQAQILRMKVSLTLVHEAAKGYAARHPKLDALTMALLGDLQDYAKTGLKMPVAEAVA